jgi:hypothetical protein
LFCDFFGDFHLYHAYLCKKQLNDFIERDKRTRSTAVVFNDQTTMRQILNEYTQLYPIRSRNYQPSKYSLAHAEQQEISTFSSQAILDYFFFSQPIRLDIHHDQKSYGELIVYGNSSDLVSFFHKILLGFIFRFYSFIGYRVLVGEFCLSILNAIRSLYC